MASDPSSSLAPGSARPGPIDPLSDSRDPNNKFSATPISTIPYGDSSLSPRQPMPAAGCMNQSGGFQPAYQPARPYPAGPMQGPYGQYPQGAYQSAPFQSQLPAAQILYSNYGQAYAQPPPVAWGPPQQQPQQQQQQQTVVIGGPQVVHQPIVISQSFCCHYTLACFVFWLFGFLFGLIAFILAAVASNRIRDDPATARQLGHASIGVSIAGIIVAVVAVSVIVPLIVTNVINVSPSSDCVSVGPFSTCFSH